MTGEELAAIRKEMGLSQMEFGEMLGYRGNQNTVHLVIKRYESRKNPKPIPLHMARYIWVLWRLWRDGSVPLDPQTGIPMWPDWSREPA